MDILSLNASSSSVPLFMQYGQIDFTTRSIATLMLLAVTLISYYAATLEKPYKGIPRIDVVKGEWSNKPAKDRWAKNSLQIAQQGLRETGDRPFQVMTPAGPLIVLPIRYLDDVKNNEYCSLTKFFIREAFATYPGMDVFGSNDPIFAAVVRQKLTQSLGGLTASLSEETDMLLKEELGDADGNFCTDWKDLSFNPFSRTVASRLSALAFLGRPQCRNKDWLQISAGYTEEAVHTLRKMRGIHQLLRPILFRFLPEAQRLQERRKQARAIIEPVIIERRKARFEAEQAGEKYEGNDAVSWFEDMADGRPYNHVSAQLFLATAAIHTTSETLLIIMYDILRHPELIQPLRDEIAHVVTEDGGLKKTTLYKLNLLDSAMKESVRVTTASPFATRRRAEREITLCDGTKIPKGAYFMVSCIHLLDPAGFGKDGKKFDPYRFLKLRQEPGQSGRWQFVTTGPDSMRFGHGTHACPGRFFAANEIKIALAHMLLKYDWKFKGVPPKGREGEYEYIPDPKTVLQFRSRTPEIDL